ncbi:MAG: glycosyltransferase family 25 protein [Rhodobacteraceae bacterium]|nr:glycosyltransferase family 25 protein [Paracoccaceae bacterium]
MPRDAFPAFVINLDGSSERLMQARAQFAGLGRDVTRVPAVDGRRFTAPDVPDYDEAATLRYMGRQMLGGELGCYLSHLRAAEMVLATGARAGFVFEDDALVPAHLFPVAEAAADWLDTQGRSDWRLLNLGYAPGFAWTPLTALGHGGREFELCAAHYFPMGAFALLWSRKGAEEFLNIARTIRAPVDNTLRHWLCRAGGGYGFRPHLGWVRTEGSDISGNAARRDHGRSALYGLKKQRRLWSDKLHALAARRREARKG